MAGGSVTSPSPHASRLVGSVQTPAVCAHTFAGLVRLEGTVNFAHTRTPRRDGRVGPGRCRCSAIAHTCALASRGGQIEDY